MSSDVIYSESFNPIWRGNPYIEALPKLPDDETVSLAFIENPPGPERLDELTRQERSALVANLKLGFYPFNWHFDLAQDIQMLIRSGYVGRNPVKGEDLKAIRGYDTAGNVNSNASSITLIGTSGMGKTTSVRRALQLFPQVIEHTQYKGITLIRRQVVWLFVDSPYDGSLGAFCRSILAAFDQTLGNTDYLGLYGGDRKTISSMMGAVSRLVETHGVGVIVLDEIQNMLSGSRGFESLNNVLTSFANITRVPVILIGTPKASIIFERSLRTARRYAMDGSFVIERFPSSQDPEWQEWFNWLFSFQYTRSHTSLTPELLEVFYKCSQGIIAIALALFRKVQTTLINDPTETSEEITPKNVEEIFQFYFKPVMPILKAIERKDYSRMEELGDLLMEIERINPASLKDVKLYCGTEKTQRQIQAAKILEENREKEILQFFKEEDLPISDEDLLPVIRQVLQQNPDLETEGAKVEVYRQIFSSLQPAAAQKKSGPADKKAFEVSSFLGEKNEF